MRKQVVSLNVAAAPVLANTAIVYENAQAIHNLRQDYDSISDFDKTDTVYNPRKLQPFPTDEEIAARKAVLDAFQQYVQDLSDITSGTSSAALDSASRSLGNNVRDAAPDMQPIKTEVNANGSSLSAGIGTAANALGQFLVSKKIKKELPQIVVKLDPYIQSLCSAFESELAILKDQERRDFDDMIAKQTEALRNDDSKSDLMLRQQRIMTLPGLVRRERADASQIDALNSDLHKLALSHHALAAVAQGNNPEGFKEKLGDLSDVASDLSNFYTSSTK